MKHIMSVAVVFTALLILAGCKDSPAQVAEKQLAAVVAQVKVPNQVDSTTTLTSISLKDKVLTSRIEIPAERLAALNTDSLSAGQVNQLSTNLISRKLRDLAVTAGVTLRYVYVHGTDSVVLNISPETLAK